MHIATIALAIAYLLAVLVSAVITVYRLKKSMDMGFHPERVDINLFAVLGCVLSVLVLMGA